MAARREVRWGVARSGWDSSSNRRRQYSPTNCSDPAPPSTFIMLVHVCTCGRIDWQLSIELSEANTAFTASTNKSWPVDVAGCRLMLQCRPPR